MLAPPLKLLGGLAPLAPPSSYAYGRLRILGGQGLEYWGVQGGPNIQQARDVVMTSMRRYDVASTSFRSHVPTRFLINQCQIITFLILKSDKIENSGIKLKGIGLPVPSNQISYIYYYFTLQLGTFMIFSCFTWKLKENAPPLKLLGGFPPLPLPTPMFPS